MPGEPGRGHHDLAAAEMRRARLKSGLRVRRVFTLPRALARPRSSHGSASSPRRPVRTCARGPMRFRWRAQARRACSSPASTAMVRKHSVPRKKGVTVPDSSRIGDLQRWFLRHIENALVSSSPRYSYVYWVTRRLPTIVRAGRFQGLSGLLSAALPAYTLAPIASVMPALMLP